MSWFKSSQGNEKKDRERSKIILVEVLKKVMSIKEVAESTVLDRIEWRN